MTLPDLRERLADVLDPWKIVQGEGGRSAVQRSKEELADLALGVIREVDDRKTVRCSVVLTDLPQFQAFAAEAHKIQSQHLAEIRRLQDCIDRAFVCASSGDSHGARIALTGARWGQLAAITDAMVERGASALATGASYNPNDVDAGAWPHIRDDYRQQARRVLEAALGGK